MATKIFVAEGVSESLAWSTFFQTIDDAELLNGSKIMSHRRGTP